mmetsp:Transcript_15870/g.19990  ORF Transcript_15870/g.19990 Transcript_15870/m.19990 type:complete len:200 (+) Transcript_15870:76-675(+)
MNEYIVYCFEGFSATSSFNIFEDSGLGQKRAQFGTFDASLRNFAICTTCEDSNLELLGVRLGHVHRFAEHLGSEHGRLLQTQILAIVVLERADRIHTVLARRVGLPRSVVARRVRAVELEALDGVVASVHQGDAEWSTAAIEGVDVLLVGEVADELLDIDRRALAEQVLLGVQAAHVDEHVSVGHHSRHRHEHMLVHLV